MVCSGLEYKHISKALFAAKAFSICEYDLGTVLLSVIL
jgi:hypothetical protein